MFIDACRKMEQRNYMFGTLEQQADIISYFVIDMRYYVNSVVFRLVLINGCQWLFKTNHDFVQVL